MDKEELRKLVKMGLNRFYRNMEIAAAGGDSSGCAVAYEQNASEAFETYVRPNLLLLDWSNRRIDAVQSSILYKIGY